MGTTRQTRVAIIALAALVVVTLAGWVAAQQIRSPAQVAADTAAPEPSPITIPVTRRTLSAEVIVRGTVRYGAPQSVVLATSQLKQAAGASDIVTSPPHSKARLDAGDVALAVDGRPVFVLPGGIPMHRDLGPGDRGPDVLQLERALSRMGAAPGPVDGRYDARAEAGVASFYLRRGYDPFGPTDPQLDALRTAETAAAAARDARLQAANNVQQARRTVRPSEIAQARIDANNARDAIGAARLRVATAQAKADTTAAAAANARAGESVASANTQRDAAQADADVAAKGAAVATAAQEARVATAATFQLPADATLADRQAAEAAANQAAAALGQAQAELNAALAAARAVRVSGSADVKKAHSDGAKLIADARVARAELRRARQGLRLARRQARLAARKAQVVTRAPDTSSLEAITSSAAREERRTAAEVARLSRAAGIQVPANEVLFFSALPLRVDAVAAKRGSTVSGRVMNVTNSRLAIDSSLSVSDQKLVRVGDEVTIEEQDLGITAKGRVSHVASTPGTNRVDPNRFYLAIVPTSNLPSLVGASVKLTISVKSTKGSVLAVPVSALSIGGDGRSRVQVRRGRRIELVPVVPGLAAEGLAEVRPASGGRLTAGDLVVVGSRGSRAVAPGGARSGP